MNQLLPQFLWHKDRKDAIVISRSDGNDSSTYELRSLHDFRRADGPVTTEGTTVPVYGILTMLNIPSCDIARTIAVLVTRVELEAHIAGVRVFRVTRTTCAHLPFGENEQSDVSALTIEHAAERLLHRHLHEYPFWFSPDANLCKPLVDGAPSTRCSGNAFDWFYQACRLLDSSPASGLRIPVITGFAGSLSDTETGLGIALISRRSRHRAGTRYGRRGANQSNVANFVATEMLVWRLLDDDFEERRQRPLVTSFMQTRGSVPLRWRQKVDLSLKPEVYTESPEEARRTAHEHLTRLQMAFGRVLAIDTLDTHGQEGSLSTMFREAAVTSGFALIHRNESCDTRADSWYYSFDLHKECAGMHYENLDHLITDVNPVLDVIGFTSSQIALKGQVNSPPVHSQSGVPRVNCFDCLDRTNVVECKLAFTMLSRMIKELGMECDIPESLAKCMRLIWCDNGDAISRQYSGTCAMKRDFTRTGVRSRRGVFEDAVNGFRRWVHNHFLDATKQDAVDLVTCPFGDDATAIDRATETRQGKQGGGYILMQCMTRYAGVWIRQYLYVFLVALSLLLLICPLLIIKVLVIASLAAVLLGKFFIAEPRLTKKEDFGTPIVQMGELEKSNGIVSGNLHADAIQEEEQRGSSSDSAALSPADLHNTCGPE